MKSQQPTIGRLLRRIRAHRGWTLKQMSAHSGIPLSTLSKVEHDRLTLTYDKLQLLSQRLNMTMSELFAEPDNSTEAAVTARRSIGRIEDAVRVKTSNYDYYYLCPELRRKRMIPVLARVRAKSLKEFGELVRHSGEEWAYVIKGTVVLHTEFYDPLTLKVGESVYIDSNMGHAYLASEDCDEATVVCACSSADEALMESLIHLLGEDKIDTKSSQFYNAESTPKKSMAKRVAVAMSGNRKEREPRAAQTFKETGSSSLSRELQTRRRSK